MPRNILFFLLVVLVLFAIFDRGQRVHLAYPAGGFGLIILILVIGLILGWF